MLLTKQQYCDTNRIILKPGSKIREARKRLGLSRKDLAKRANVHYDTIAKIERGERRNLATLQLLAKCLDISLEYLFTDYLPAVQFEPVYSSELSGVAEGREVYVLGEGRQIPVLGWVEAGEFAQSGDKGYAAGMADEYIYSDIASHSAFALKVRGNSMEPEFKEGQYIIVNPDVETHNGEYVIAKLDWEDAATFKQVAYEKDAVLLKPLNPEYNTIRLTEKDDFRIVGKVVEAKTIYSDKTSTDNKKLAETISLLSSLDQENFQKAKAFLEWLASRKVLNVQT